MRSFALVIVASLLLAACGSGTDVPPSPTPTAAITSGFIGPLLGESTGGETGACSEESGCGITSDMPVEMDDAPLPLVPQQAGSFSIGLPQGYKPIILPDEVLIRAESPDALGGFTVSLREVNAAALAGLLELFGTPDFQEGTPVQTQALTGWLLPTGDYGVIVLLQTEDGRQIFIEAYAASAGYWEAFRATFDQMLASLSI